MTDTPFPNRTAGAPAAPAPAGAGRPTPAPWRPGVPRDAEWLEPDGLGGFASGCVDGVRRRVYHALLLAATAPPTGRVVLVNGVKAWVEVEGLSFPLSSQMFDGGTMAPDSADRIRAFHPEPWPRWKWHLGDGFEIEHEVFVPKGRPCVVLSWRLRGLTAGASARLKVRPLLTGRDYHGILPPGGRRDLSARVDGLRVQWHPDPELPAVTALSNGAYTHAPRWFHDLWYAVEAERGLPCVEDCGSPGEYEFDLSKGEAFLVLEAGTDDAAVLADADGRGPDEVAALVTALRTAERDRRSDFPTDLHRAADAYIVRRGAGLTILAGYPWFTDWGRDTFIALRGLCLATGRLDDARRILVEWSGLVSEGMLPNYLGDTDEAHYNSVDASLWFATATCEWLALADAAAAEGDAPMVDPEDRAALTAAVEAILTGYGAGTRYGIRRDPADGLLACGVPGSESQLTWMDARSDGVAVTPRVGKPVEIQALWANALHAGATMGCPGAEGWARWRDEASTSFAAKFWNAGRECLFDVVDVDHVPGAVDGSVRPNMLLAAGGLPLALIDGDRARSVVDTAERLLMTPLGPRSLAPGEPGYAPRYTGGRIERDARYHQGTVWPWTAGPFVDAWVRARGGTAEAKREARVRFVEPLLRHLGTAGIGHVCEVADAEAPHTPRGCPFQAWSLGELLRLLLVALKEP